MSAGELAILVPIGIGVGAFSALFGVGGGVIAVPVLVLAFGLDQHVAQGTSLAMIVPTALAGVAAHHKRGFVEIRSAAILGAGGVIGVLVGSRVALAISGDLLRDLFGGFLVLFGLRLAWRYLGPA